MSDGARDISPQGAPLRVRWRSLPCPRWRRDAWYSLRYLALFRCWRLPSAAARACCVVTGSDTFSPSSRAPNDDWRICELQNYKLRAERRRAAGRAFFPDSFPPISYHIMMTPSWECALQNLLSITDARKLPSSSSLSTCRLRYCSLSSARFRYYAVGIFAGVAAAWAGLRAFSPRFALLPPRHFGIIARAHQEMIAPR